MKFAGKTILITGAARGIGRATAVEFAREGANIIVNYVNSEKLAESFTNDLAEKYNVRAIALRGDVADDVAIQRMYERVLDEFGGLDVLVNNAGVVVDKPYVEHTKDDFDRIFDTNVYGILAMSRQFGPLIAESSQSGAIVNMSSTSGMYDFWPDNIDYAGSKAAIQSITKDLAIHFDGKVRVNAIALGWADTDMNKDLPAEDVEEANKKFIAGRMADPVEVAKPILFLASDDASFINGATLVVDGGRY